MIPTFAQRSPFGGITDRKQEHETGSEINVRITVIAPRRTQLTGSSVEVHT